MSTKPILHRDDPLAEPLVGNIKVTRDDWLNVAMDVLVSDGVEQVKVMNLAERMAVSRSSFYWYFKSRQELLDALLAKWQATNTAGLIAQSELPAQDDYGCCLQRAALRGECRFVRHGAGFCGPRLGPAVGQGATDAGPVGRAAAQRAARHVCPVQL